MSARVEALLRQAYELTGMAQSITEEAMLYPMDTSVNNSLLEIHKELVMARADLLILIPKLRTEGGQ